MTTVYHNGTLIGDVDPAEGNYGGWFATLIDADQDFKFIEETFHVRKRDAVAHLKSAWKGYVKEREEVAS